jgi:hypothetical protein
MHLLRKCKWCREWLAIQMPVYVRERTDCASNSHSIKGLTIDENMRESCADRPINFAHIPQ